MNTSSPINYKFIIDNIDKNVKPSFQRAEIKGRSYHHVHGYSVQDRIDTSKLSDRIPLFRKADASVFLPGQQDVNALRDEIIIFLTRIVSEHLQQYKPYENEIQKHIPSKYSNEMATKSNVVGSISFFEYCYKIILQVPLGVLLYDENKLDEMSHVLEHYMQFVPKVGLYYCQVVRRLSIIIPNSMPSFWEETS